MKKRVLSAIIMALIFIPVFIIGGNIFNFVFYIITLLGLNEIMMVREKEKKLPNFIRLISYIMITFLYFTLNTNFHTAYIVIAGLFLLLLLPVVLYSDEKIYNIEDAFYVLSSTLFIGLSMSLFYAYRKFDLKIIIFLLLITIITDSYAYFTGRLIGKHKLIEVISPNKTWEGLIGGSIMATFVSTVYYLTVINSSANILVIIFTTLFLSIIGQFGDLFFSSIKRKYNIKDFSNLIPVY